MTPWGTFKPKNVYSIAGTDSESALKGSLASARELKKMSIPTTEDREEK